MSFSLNSLTDTEFENFCFDVLQSLGFVNLSWRKGTGLTSSPSDQGRDIQGNLLRRDVDGREHHEKWFIECKSYLKGVPPDKIQGAITWANAERPDVLLFIASNFLSNPTKNYLENYEETNKPPYRIKVWERKDLESLTAGKNSLRLKYGLPTEIAFLSILNDYHIVYSMKPHLNTVEYFIELMDSLVPSKRDEAFSFAYHDLINPHYRKSVSGKEKLADLEIDSTDYDAFRKKCLSSESKDSPSFVHKLVTSALAWLFHMADKTSIEDTQSNLRWIVERLEADIANEEDEERRGKLTRMLDLPNASLEELPSRVENHYELYTYVCNELVRKLLMEKPKLVS
jgi:hypothetical protein